MPVMDKLRQCAEKMGYRLLDVPPEFAKAIDEAYDAVFKDEEKSEPQKQFLLKMYFIDSLKLIRLS